VSEHLELDALAGAQLDLGQAQLARQRHSMGTELVPAPGDPARVVDVRLRGHMDLDLRPEPAHLCEQPPVLDDEGVGTEFGGPADEGEGTRHLGRADDHVLGHVDAGAGQMGLTARLGEGSLVEVAGTTAGVEVAAEAAVDGIRTGGEGGSERLRPASRGEKLGHAGITDMRGAHDHVERTHVLI
jgi:hypothetical protein